MKSSDVEAAAVAYLEATGGNAHRALEAAIADLFDAQREAAFRTLALDQWVSRGYVRGNASEELSGPRRSFWLGRIMSARVNHDQD